MSLLAPPRISWRCLSIILPCFPFWFPPSQILIQTVSSAKARSCCQLWLALLTLRFLGSKNRPVPSALLTSVVGSLYYAGSCHSWLVSLLPNRRLLFQTPDWPCSVFAFPIPLILLQLNLLPLLSDPNACLISTLDSLISCSFLSPCQLFLLLAAVHRACEELTINSFWPSISVAGWST